jgi:hypothetical protein
MKKLIIMGPRGGVPREYDRIKRYIKHCEDILGLKKYNITLSVIVCNKFTGEFDDAVGLCYPWNDLKDITVELARKTACGISVPILETLSHEMIHVKQAAKGEYMYENPARKHESFLHSLVMERM